MNYSSLKNIMIIIVSTYFYSHILHNKTFFLKNKYLLLFKITIVQL